MSLVENYQKVLNEIPEDITLIAVSKTKPVADIQALYDAGHRDFGENKVQEMVDKAAQLPKDIRWHMIGHVQSNKIKYMTDFVHLIHGIDKAKRLKEVNKRAKQANRVQDVLLQIYIADEDTKYGMDHEEAKQILTSDTLKSYENVRIVGLMGMATFTDNQDQVRAEFKKLKQIFIDLKEIHPELKHISMGMSGDYPIAIEEGSTMVRIGSAIFGERNYD
ncbi:YggS family pyridoxal phosphate-dependent enzyme [Flavobacteriaceae bacterium Ap0902]|nr:YggS family pyridoxal phosphate-dependent enzyme [Flavobacteriaceae bacterium Ap0902]